MERGYRELTRKKWPRKGEVRESDCKREEEDGKGSRGKERVRKRG